NLCRAFNAQSANLQAQSDGYLNPQTVPMSQDIYRPPTVFSYFSPDAQLPGSTTIGAPEFAIMTSYTSLKRANFVNQMTLGGGIGVSTNAPNGTALTL